MTVAVNKAMIAVWGTALFQHWTPHCYFDSRASMTVSWSAGFSRSSLRMWAGMWHWESQAHSSAHSTKTSMWHLTMMPDEGRKIPQTTTALPFKKWPRGPCPERRHQGLYPSRLLASSLSFHLRTLVCPRLLISVTLSLVRGGQACVVCY